MITTSRESDREPASRNEDDKASPDYLASFWLILPDPTKRYFKLTALDMVAIPDIGSQIMDQARLVDDKERLTSGCLVRDF